jgi:hypothetical protein
MMDETPRQRLARLMSGAPANSSPMPNFAVGANPNMSPMPNFAAQATVPPSAMPNFAPPGDSARYMPPMRLPQMPPANADPYAFLPPYAGLRNEQALPPFEQPGASLPMDRYMQPRPAPAPMPAAQPQPAPMPPMQTGGQGWGGPEPAPGTMPELQAAFDPNDPRYLPEQWRGAFNQGWQS